MLTHDVTGVCSSDSEMTVTEKIVRVLFNIGKGIAVLFLLYFFIIAIDVLGASFQLVAGQYRAQELILVIRKIRVIMIAKASISL